MIIRTAIAACAAAMIVAAPSFADAPAQAAPNCAETSFRVYFAPGSARLDSTTNEILDVAARGIAECPYAELRIAVDASSPLAARRGQAIAAAVSERDWNQVRIEPRGAQRVSHDSGPEYAEVVMSPNASATPATPLPTTPNIGA
jgi:hypothetical protein